MERALKSMLKDTPLVMNLRNKDFMEILLNGKRVLAQRFADIDAGIVRRQMRGSNGTEYTISARMKRIVSSPTFPESITSLIDKKAS